MRLNQAADRNPRARRIITLLGALLVATAVLTGGCGRNGGPTEQTPGTAAADEATATPVQVATAMRTTIEDTLEITGTAQATDQVDVVSEVSGRVARVHADVGDYVRRGSTLVRVDTQVAAAQRDQAAASVQSARAALNQAREALRLTDQTTASTVRQAEVGVTAAQERLEQARAAARLVESQVNSAIQQAGTAVRSAETRLAEVRAGARDQERRQAEAQVQQAKAALDLAEQTHSRYQRLLEGGVIAQQQFDQVRTEYQLAQQRHRQALEQLSLVQEGARSEQVRLAELNVEQARQQLAQAEANRTQIEVVQQDVRAAEEGLRQAREQVNAAIAGRGQVQVQERQVASASAGVDQAQAGERISSVQLGKHVVSSPISGLVASRMVEVGEGAMPGAPVMRIVRIDPIRIDAVVNELDIERVATGDVGLVRFDGLAGREFRGTVTRIEPQAITDSRNYVARIEVPNPDGAAKPGMFARVSLLLGTRENVVVVTRDALLERDHARQVYVVADGAVSIRDVEIGVIEGNLVEILDGVREGETVIVSGQDALAEGQRVSPVSDNISGDTNNP
ncbi:MAG: efflux RND transporter periplasmic adaptor subunit [Armatimonadota bacterium]|jgi:RND family efflux transporter MFP subunit